MTRRLFAASVFFSVTLGAAAARAEPGSSVIETKDGDRITISADEDAGEEAARELARTLEHDLALEDLTRPERVKQSLAFSGEVHAGATELTAALVFRDVREERVLLERKYKTRPETARELAHELAREITVNLTGRKSLATTKLLVVREGKEGARDLWSVDIDGRGLRPLTDVHTVSSRPSWSRDGGTVLFTSSARRKPELYEMKSDGGIPTLLSAEPGLNADGRSSPDGKYISLTLSRDGNSEVYLLDRASSAYRRLTEEWAKDAGATWSPSGARLAFISSRAGYEEIFVLDMAGGAPQRLTSLKLHVSSLDWSPEGDRIVFAARDQRNVSDLYSVDPDSGAVARLTRDLGDNYDPSFSPDGRHIVFVSTRTSGEADLWIMDGGGANATKIASGGGYSSPSWSPFLEDATRARQDGGPYLTLSIAR